MIQIQTEEPNYNNLSDIDYDWTYTAYRSVIENIPKNILMPLGNPVLTPIYKDVNLYYDFLIGKAVIGIFHLFN